MADEVQVRWGFTINKDGTLLYSPSRAFQADMDGDLAGFKPGGFIATVAGTSVDLSELTTPGGIAEVINLDSTNFVTYGIWDGLKFYPLGELRAGESFPIRLSRYLGEEYGSTGTGTSGAGINSLRFKADTAACEMALNGFNG